MVVWVKNQKGIMGCSLQKGKEKVWGRAKERLNFSHLSSLKKKVPSNISPKEDFTPSPVVIGGSSHTRFP